MKIFCLSLLALPVLGAIFQPPVELHSVELVQWPGDIGGNNHFFEAVESPAGITWDDATAYATGHGGYLATILSKQENDFVFKLIDDSGFWTDGPQGDSWGPWLGGTKLAGASSPSAAWSWDFSQGPNLFTYTDWSNGQPNDQDVHGNHLHYYAAGHSVRQPEWAVVSGTELLHGFVVEYDKPPLPQSLGYIALASVCLTALLVLTTIIFVFVRQRRRNREAANSSAPTPPTPS